MTLDEVGFLVMVHPRRRRGRGRYWGHNQCGYNDSAVTAGVYSQREAEEITGNVLGREQGLRMVLDPLARTPGTVIRLPSNWNEDPMLAAYLRGWQDRGKQ